MISHSFDTAIHLTPDFDIKANQFLGMTSPAWWNTVGPWGGVSAAVVLNAVMTHPSCLGAPVALTMNYASGLKQGVFKVVATPARTNRSTQHWWLELRQADANGVDVVVLTGTAITAVRRETWSANDLPMPVVTPAEDVHRITPTANTMAWIQRYDLRPVIGPVPAQWDVGASSDDPMLASLSQIWVRDDPLRPLDFASLAAMSDIFFPRILLRRPVKVPAGTVSMTVYFHAGAAELAESGTGYLLGQARGQTFRNGFFDQAGQLWNAAGTLLVTTHQLVYYKE